MLRFGTTARWLITALLAVWVPVCCCEASGLVGAVQELVSGAGDEGSCCCCADEGERPAPAPGEDGPCRDGCCALAVKITATPRPEVGPLAAGVAVLPPPVAMCSCGVVAASIPGRSRPQAVPTPAPTLLRLHCALTV